MNCEICDKFNKTLYGITTNKTLNSEHKEHIFICEDCRDKHFIY